ncbi:hypothetical protein F5050DRAFT_1710504 [Lentinula boryana]|uniref:Uncharacterized protein n=1 Tax=Lentinula boryana TaxID=40481 RepID=A0ABQ8QIZ0_9AGAR|nr:hypothetical protein F5050DRAFT_1710504 [Lentinula boryana]
MVGPIRQSRSSPRYHPYQRKEIHRNPFIKYVRAPRSRADNEDVEMVDVPHERTITAITVMVAIAPCASRSTKPQHRQEYQQQSLFEFMTEGCVSHISKDVAANPRNLARTTLSFFTLDGGVVILTSLWFRLYKQQRDKAKGMSTCIWKGKERQIFEEGLRQGGLQFKEKISVRGLTMHLFVHEHFFIEFSYCQHLRYAKMRSTLHSIVWFVGKTANVNDIPTWAQLRTVVTFTPIFWMSNGFEPLKIKVAGTGTGGAV